MDKAIDIVAALQDEETAGRITNYTARKAAAKLLELEAENAQLLADMKLCQAKNLELFAENAKLCVMYDRASDAAKDLGDIRDRLEAENEQLRKERQAFKDVAEYQKSENAKLKQVLIDIAYGLEGSRIWGGMEWTYNPLHPFKYLPLRDAARAALGENE